MENWIVVVRGVGPLGSQNSDAADKLAKDFVGTLKNAGHRILDASVHSTQMVDLSDAVAPGMNLEDLAREMFNAYNAQEPNPGKTHDGKPVPPWDELNDQVRGKWLAAARHAYDRS